MRLVRAAFLILTSLVCLLSLVTCANRPMYNPDYMTAEQFDAIASDLLKPVYPLLAQQILFDYRISFGRCLDVGGGAGYLAIELAKRSGLMLTVLDIDPDAIELAKKNIKAADLAERIDTVVADAADIPFPDSSFELVVSRGSFPFWEDKVSAFREIYRVLKPGGIGVVGGGFGRDLPVAERAKIVETLRKEVPGLSAGNVPRLKIAKILHEAGIEDYALLRDAPPHLTCPCQVWIEIHKH